jgi:hypothetical protein
MNVNMLEENDAAYVWKSTGNTFDNESMICEFRITLYYKLKAKKGPIFLRKLCHLWLPIMIQYAGAKEIQISYNNKLDTEYRYRRTGCRMHANFSL